jgi:hypothetical protein
MRNAPAVDTADRSLHSQAETSSVAQQKTPLLEEQRGGEQTDMKNKSRFAA